MTESGLAVCKDHSVTTGREVRCMLFHLNTLYFGDDGVNIKMYDMATKSLSKLRNHENGMLVIFT